MLLELPWFVQASLFFFCDVAHRLLGDLPSDACHVEILLYLSIIDGLLVFFNRRLGTFVASTVAVVSVVAMS